MIKRKKKCFFIVYYGFVEVLGKPSGAVGILAVTESPGTKTNVTGL
jgi:hypothetical protein